LFVKFHLLPASGRVAFTQAPDSLFSQIDLDKAKNQIPLIDQDNKKVFYGIDALVEVLSQKFPLIRTICEWSFVSWFLKKLYKLVSYNRKVIVAKKCGQGQFDCSPEFNLTYRMTFLIGFLFSNSLMLWPIHTYILSTVSYYHVNFWQLESAHLLFVFANCLLACFLPFNTALEYLGQVNMLALSTVLFCIPLFLIIGFLGAIDLLILSYLVLLTAFIVKEYFRRMQYAGIIPSYKMVAGVNLLCLFAFLVYLFI
jgi:hypothetical protein